MSHDVGSLTRALRGALAVDEFIVSDVKTSAAAFTMGPKASRSQRQVRALEATIYVDCKRGRGTAHLAVDPGQPLGPQVQEASTRAFEALGVAWQLPAPAAPARVLVHDPSMRDAPAAIARELMSEFRASLPTSLKLIEARVAVQRSTHRALLSNGFNNQFQSSEIAIAATVEASGGIAVPMHLQARRRSDLDFAGVAERAHSRSVLDAGAQPIEPGLYDLVLQSAAYRPRDSADYGIWTPLVAQASAERIRAGMSIHNPGLALLPEPPLGEALTIESVGTEPFGLRSAPFTDDGQAIRNFMLADTGQAIGFSVNHRDSALGDGPANGGARRLVIANGKLPAEELLRPGARPVLVAHSIATIRTQDRGHVYLEISSGELLRRDALGRVQTSPMRSAIVCGKLHNWLGEAYFSSETSDENWLLGPTAIRLNNVRAH